MKGDVLGLRLTCREFSVDVYSVGTSRLFRQIDPSSIP